MIARRGVPAFYFLSLAATILATTLIIIRIVSIVRHSKGGATRYAVAIEILVESGALYAATLMVTSILYIVQGDGHSVNQVRRSVAALFWQEGILPPVTVE